MKKTTVNDRVLLRLDYFDLFREWPAAIVLSQIYYWYQPGKDGKSKLTVYKKGHWWIVKSHRGWWDDCRLSRRQVDRAINLLVQKKLIEVKVMRYGRGSDDHGPPPVRHIRSLGFHLKGHSMSAPTGGVTDSTPGCNGTSINYGTKTTAETTLASQGKKSQEKKAQGKSKVKNPSPNCAAPLPMDSKQTLAKLQEKQKPATGFPETLPVKNAAALALWWQRLVPHYYPQYWQSDGLKVKPLTGKEIGMLAKFMQAVGKADAYAVMHWSVKAWPAFANEVLYAKGSKSGVSPTWPRVNYLYAHWDVAVICYKKSQQPNLGPALLSEAEQKAHILGGKK
jgi:hypothetical protein